MGMNDVKRRELLLRSGKGKAKEAAEEVKAAAIEVYLSQRHLPDHNEYVTSFSIEEHPEKPSYIVKNTDRHWFWVEFGAHAGGKTPVLGYAPFRRAIDIVSSRS